MKASVRIINGENSLSEFWFLEVCCGKACDAAVCVAFVMGNFCLGRRWVQHKLTFVSMSHIVIWHFLVPDYCSLPAVTGQCRAAIPMYYYNSTFGECMEFIYGGCPGNDNRFTTKEECIRTCSPGQCSRVVFTFTLMNTIIFNNNLLCPWFSEICSLRPEVGPCKANIRLWFYNAEHRACQEFSYGGCQGNQNKFVSKTQCETACAGSEFLQFSNPWNFLSMIHKLVAICHVPYLYHWPSSGIKSMLKRSRFNFWWHLMLGVQFYSRHQFPIFELWCVTLLSSS